MAEGGRETVGGVTSPDLASGRHLSGLTRIADRGLIDLKLAADTEAARGKVGKILGFDLPETADRSVAAGGNAALFLSPNHWLVSCRIADRAATLQGLEKALPKRDCALTDVSDAWTILRLSPATVADLLARCYPHYAGLSELADAAVLRLRMGPVAIMLNIVGLSPLMSDAYARRSTAWLVEEMLNQPTGSLDYQAVFGPQQAPPV